jgi:hypothetical protein
MPFRLIHDVRESRALGLADVWNIIREDVGWSRKGTKTAKNRKREGFGSRNAWSKSLCRGETKYR